MLINILNCQSECLLRNLKLFLKLIKLILFKKIITSTETTKNVNTTAFAIVFNVNDYFLSVVSDICS